MNTKQAKVLMVGGFSIAIICGVTGIKIATFYYSAQRTIGLLLLAVAIIAAFAGKFGAFMLWGRDANSNNKASQ